MNVEPRYGVRYPAANESQFQQMCSVAESRTAGKLRWRYQEKTCGEFRLQRAFRTDSVIDVTRLDASPGQYACDGQHYDGRFDRLAIVH